MSQEFVDRNRLWARLGGALRDWESSHGPAGYPVMAVDLEAFDANAADLVRRAGGTPLRVASKSLRVPELLRRALDRDGFRGILAYSLAEAIWLFRSGISDDVVVGYPTVDRAALADLVGSPSTAAGVTLMIDDPAHLDVVDSLRASRAVPIRVAIDIDAGLHWGSQHVGPKRSSLYDAAQVIDLAKEVTGRGGFRLVGVMTYEGQVAGVPDDVPTQRARSAVMRRIKQASVTQLATRRREIHDALTQIADLEFWNAGGSGSVQTSAADPVVTEVAAGSGLLVPSLFDHYRSFKPRPAAFYGVPVVRRPSPELATLAGGGYIASGPTGDDRAPLPWAPPGLHLTSMEGAGEVQTPVTGHPAAMLEVGDMVWFRHAKSGELFEHGNEVLLVQGSSVVGSVPSYRGLGHAFG